MKVKRVDGILLRRMLINGLFNLKQNEEKINAINVFPVPDGDTGSNMRLTLENGLRHANINVNAGLYLADLATGMLYGARGNSGVILSQIFNGMANELRRDSIIDAGEFVEGFKTGYKYAYKAVAQPKEGTLLTVAREGISSLDNHVSRGTYVDVFFSIFLAEMRKSLANTPNLLPMLKEAGVIDSGGLGFITIVEGMYMYLQDEKLEDVAKDNKPVETDSNNALIFNENSEMKYGYCTEFILQILNRKEPFDESVFLNEISKLGDSLVFVNSDNKIKVHIHTKTPGIVINYAQRFGEFISFKIENMQLQNEEIKDSKENAIPKKLAKIAICNGLGIKKIYEELGCDYVINGGKTMNTSTEEIINAIKTINADNYAIITNNKNIVLSAEQASRVLNEDNIYVIPTSNILEGYYSLAMDENDNDNIEYRIKQMKDAKDSIKTIEFFEASRDSKIDGIKIKEGNYTSMSDGVVLDSNSNLLDCIIDSLKKIENIDDYSACIVLKGMKFSLKTSDLEEALNENFASLEITALEGGQLVHNLIIGLI